MQIIKKLKQSGQDYEFYPTTPEIISDLKYHIPPGASVLDVGAGRGDVLKALDHAGDLFAIEKSKILIEQLPDNIFIVGTDFHNQTLIDKKVDVVFSNPPFSEFENWVVKIITETLADKIFLVIPERWINSNRIKSALNSRNATAISLGKYSFLEAERKARGTVNLVQISMHSYKKQDPFKLWFEKTFPPPEKENKTQETRPEQIKSNIAKGRNLIEVLEELYFVDMDKLLQVFQGLQNIPDDLLSGLSVSRSDILNSLKTKIENLKHSYWYELFENLSKLTSRLTKSSREKMLSTLHSRTYIDFTADNAYAVIIWAIKNANKYTDNQIIQLYKDLSSPENCSAYKSNKHFTTADFRYNLYNNNVSHYKLDYRIVATSFHPFSGYSFELCHGISKVCRTKLNDICTVAKTMGFDVMECAESFDWKPGQENIFYYLDTEPEEFMKIRLYKNGNAHIKFCKKFLLKLNVEAARLLGWINTPWEAAEELCENIQDVENIWNSVEKLSLTNIKLLGE